MEKGQEVVECSRVIAIICLMPPTPAEFSKTVFLHGREFVLRLPQPLDALQVVGYSNEFNAESEFTLFPEERITLTDAQGYINRVLAKIQRGEAVYLFAFCQEQLVGRVSLNLDSGVQRHQGELGISVRQGFRNLGLGRVMIEEVLELASQNLPGLEQAWLTTFANNDRALHLYQKLGFREFGRLPRGIKRGEEYCDFVYMWKRVGEGD